MSPLYRSVMAVLEAAHIPASVRADVDHIFHNPPTEDAAATYNPDEWAPPPNQYPHWLEAGSPPYDVLGRELDVRGWPTGNTKPIGSPQPPANQRGSYFQAREGEMPGSGFWRVGFSAPTDLPLKTIYTIEPGYATNLMSQGDGGYAQGDVTFTVNGVQIPLGGQLPVEPGDYELVATCVDNAHTREVGSLATFSIVKNA